MQTASDDFGDRPIALDLPQFSLGEACFLARIPRPRQFYEWRHRQLVTFGRQERPAGPIRFSLLDGLRLSVLADLCVRADLLTIPEAVTVGELVAQVAVRSTDPVARRDGTRSSEWVLVGWSEAGEMLAQTADIAGPGRYLPPRHRADDGFEPLRRPHLAIPATQMLTDIVLRTQSLASEHPPRERAYA